MLPGPLFAYGLEFAKIFDKVGAPAVTMTPLKQYATAGAGDLEFERLWLPLKGILIKKVT
jgi:hypothetical protein